MTAEGKCRRCQGQLAEGKCPTCDKADGLLSKMLGKQTTLETFFMDGLVKDMQRSWTMQPLESRRTRMQIILAMAGELAEIRKTTIQATRFCEWAIEGVITGKVRDILRGRGRGVRRKVPSHLRQVPSDHRGGHPEHEGPRSRLGDFILTKIVSVG
jgi:hypothetical protein